MESEQKDLASAYRLRPHKGVISSVLRLTENAWDPSNLTALMNAAALIRETEGNSTELRFSIEARFAIEARVDKTVKLGAAGVQNVTLPNTQLINRLKRVSQLCPRTAEQLESNCVTKKVTVWKVPHGN
jgi:hypothetical protein